MNNESVKLFEDLMSPQKEIRNQAELKLQQVKSYNLEDALKIFIGGMQSDSPVVSQLATLMLKKTYFDDSEVLKTISPQQCEIFKQVLKEFVNLV